MVWAGVVVMVDEGDVVNGDVVGAVQALLHLPYGDTCGNGDDNSGDDNNDDGSNGDDGNNDGDTCGDSYGGPGDAPVPLQRTPNRCKVISSEL